MWHWHPLNWLDCWCNAVANFCVLELFHHHNLLILSTVITKTIHDSRCAHFRIFFAIWLQPHNLSVCLRNINRNLNRYWKNFLRLHGTMRWRRFFRHSGSSHRSSTTLDRHDGMQTKWDIGSTSGTQFHWKLTISKVGAVNRIASLLSMWYVVYYLHKW